MSVSDGGQLWTSSAGRQRAISLIGRENCRVGRGICVGCNFARLRQNTAFNTTSFITSAYVNTSPQQSLWHNICVNSVDMVSNLSRLDEINVLASEADWAWPDAVRDIFRPRGVNLLVAGGAEQFINIIEQKRIHTTIVDMDSETGGLATIKIIRMDYPLMPCILLTSGAGEDLLGKALQLDVFSVIDKPIDMDVLREQLNRLFLKKYNSDIFAA